MGKARSLVGWIAAAFGAVAAAFGAVNLMLVLSLRPDVERAEEIASTHAVSLSLLSRMRGFVAEMRDTVVLSQELGLERSKPLLASQEQVLRAGTALAESARQCAPLMREAGQLALWETVRREGLDPLPGQAHRALEAVAAGSQHGEQVAQFVALAAKADAWLQSLADLSAASAGRDAQRIRASLDRFSLGSLALGLGGALSAFAMLLLGLSAIRRYTRAAEARVADLEAFASRVAHDLRSPLQVIHIALASVGQSFPDSSLAAHCARAERSARRLDRMIEDLLLFSQGAEAPPETRRSSVAEVMDGLQDEMAARAAESKVAFEFDVEPGLAAAMPVGALRSVLANLLDNAFKFLDPEREQSVQATARRAPDGSLVLSVRDSGRGIPPEALPHVFEVGYRTGSGSPGFGIGLATVKRLVEAFGGSVEVHSQVGRGTTFTVRLPAAP